MKMGTDGQAEKDKGEIVPGKSQSEQCPNEEEEVESKADRRTVGLRCFQGNRETSEDEPSELGAAVVTSSEPAFLVPPLSSQPQYLDCDFDVELTAEVKVENGACLALLTSVTPNLGYQKPGSFLNVNFHFPPSLRKKRVSIDSFLPSGSFSGCYSSVIQASGQMQPASSLKNSDGVIEMAKSPLPSSPSNSPSSPSSAPSSPSSSPSSSSPGGMGTNYREDEDRGHAGGSRGSKGTGDFVSSTSSSLVPSSMPVPPSSNPSLHPSSSITHPCNDGQRESLENDIYDPFHPTEGEGERDQASTEDEEEEVDKYDPFEPTGSPASETEEEKRCMDEENEGGSSINSEGNVAKADRALEMGTPAGTEGGPPDSTEIDAPSSMFNNVPLELNSKRSIKDRIREQGKNQRERGTDSEHSEIEEGEIVGANERGRERVIERRREVLLPSSSSPSYLQAGVPKPERILRVLDGDGFVSVRADEEWEREPVASVGIGDLRRKLTSRRKERFRSCPSSASISPPPVPVLPLPSPSFPNSPPLSTGKGKSHKSSKSSKDRDRRKRKEGRGDKEKRKKRKEEKESGEGKRESKERDCEKRSVNENKDKDRDRGRSSQSDSHKRKKRRRSTPEHSSRSHSQNASRHTHSHRSWSSHSEDRHKDRDQDKEREREQERNHERDRDRDRWRDDRDRERDRDSRRRDEQRRDRDEDIRKSSSRERGSTKRSRGSSDGRDREKEMVGERDRDRDRRRDVRPVVPPSIQDLNGSDLFAIKRTITVTTTTTTTTVPGSPPHSQRCSRSPSQSSDKHRKRKKKRRRRSDDKERKDEEHRSRSSPTSLTPPRYHGYESDRLSDRPEIDMLSLDGEALDSDYPSLEDSPLLPPPPEPPLPSPKIKSGAPKTSRHHLKKKSRSSKTVGNTTSLQPTASSSTTKRGRKTGKEKIGKKDAGRSGRSKKLSGGTRKVSSSSINKLPPPPPPPLPWSLQTGVDCTAGGVLALTALLFKMEEANIASRAKAQEFIQATSQILSQANQNQSQSHPPLSSSSVSSQVPPPPSHAPPPGPTPAQFILHSSVPLVGCTKTPPSHLHPGLSMGGGCAQTPPPPLPVGMTGPTGGSEMGWDNESKDPDKYLKKLHTQERAVEEVKLAIKPYYQRKDINKDEYKDILRKAVHKICHSRTGEINPVKVSNLVKLYVQRYKYFRKHGRKMDEEEKEDRESASMHSST
ncbi:splicing factor, arginine/serine-rich 19-like isoform X4 [Sinocyclocheilus grahami]|uniref:Splicing factor, arginine/serine-rich 19-like n=1 Tax=Sinocyclocheilus grahami TaxID=75366 RepID=A0A672TC78_SINGR|nr:PREDICTED: splicing factor, arginine/serine-rich 19-like isoform X4 [Sinocyclocheilus grahami]